MYEHHAGDPTSPCNSSACPAILAPHNVQHLCRYIIEYSCKKSAFPRPPTISEENIFRFIFFLANFLHCGTYVNRSILSYASLHALHRP